MFINALFGAECKFVAGAAAIDQIPSDIPLPEVAFAGRSNVGKSSLLNAIVNRKKCARTSRFPGRTQQINFFVLADRLSLVDLPGYGFATISKEVRRSWDQLLHHYFKNRINLRRVFLLIDARHGLKKSDEEMMELLDNFAIVYQVVLTKIDKAPQRREVEENIAKKIAQQSAGFPTIISSSTKYMEGIDSVRREIFSFVEE
jgi:GTP-binding protein